MFQLTHEEAGRLGSQTVTLRKGRGQHRKYLPYAFTEQGVAMLSSVLRSPRAVRVNIEIMRAFVRLREVLASQADLARKLDALEQKYDAQFKVVFDAIRELMAPRARSTTRCSSASSASPARLLFRQRLPSTASLAGSAGRSSSCSRLPPSLPTCPSSSAWMRVSGWSGSSVLAHRAIETPLSNGVASPFSLH